MLDVHRTYVTKANELMAKKRNKLKLGVNYSSKNDFYEDHGDALKLRKLAKKSERANVFAEEKNKIEQKRLQFLQSLITRAQQSIDTKWNENYMELEYMTTRLLETTNDIQRESSFNKKKPKIFSPLKTPPSLTRVSFNREPSNVTYSDGTHEALRSVASLDSDYCKEIKHFQTRPRTELLESRTSWNSAGKSTTECCLHSCRYSAENKSSVNSGCETTSVSTLFGSQCSLYPCSPLRSYTSIIGPKNDRKVKTAHSRVSSEFADSSEEIVRCEKGITDGEIEAMLNRSVSKKVPFKKFDTMKNFRFKIKALEKHSDMTKKQNHEKHLIYDRNIRYGGELPKSALYRQLRILSASEAPFDKRLGFHKSKD